MGHNYSENQLPPESFWTYEHVLNPRDSQGHLFKKWGPSFFWLLGKCSWVQSKLLQRVSFIMVMVKPALLIAFLKEFHAGWLVSESPKPRRDNPTLLSNIKLKALCWVASSSATNFKIFMFCTGVTLAVDKSPPSRRGSASPTRKSARVMLVMVSNAWLIVRKMTFKRAEIFKLERGYDCVVRTSNSKPGKEYRCNVI